MYQIGSLEIKSMIIETENSMEARKPSTDGINSRFNTIKERISEVEVRIRKIIQKTAGREKNLLSVVRKMTVNLEFYTG